MSGQNEHQETDVTKPTAVAGRAAALFATVEGQVDNIVRRLPPPPWRSRRAQPPPAHRPDGSLVRVEAPKSEKQGGPVAVVTAPFRSAGRAVGDRWSDAMREARLAARDKETEIRAKYERGVAHDARLHAEQRRRNKGPAQ